MAGSHCFWSLTNLAAAASLASLKQFTSIRHDLIVISTCSINFQLNYSLDFFIMTKRIR